MNMYFIALVAPEDINKQVLKWKTWMKERYNCEVALRSPAHITLIPPFWMKPELENNMIGSVNEFSITQKDFIVQLNNFSHFKSRVIFIDAVPNGQLTNLKDDLLLFLLKAGQYPLKKDDLPFHPHVTIATRDHYKKAFEEAWEHFKEKKYSVEWAVKGISLLKHNNRNWDVIATSSFMPVY
jgi:2'-5' RNA ligase